MTKVLIPPHVRPARTPMAILGLPFDNITTQETLELIGQMIASGRPHRVATANMDFVAQARRDIELRRILLNADLVLCDGTPLVWASRLLGNPLPERVAGADLVPQLMSLAAERRWRVFLLGATPESAAQAVENLQRELPDLPVVGHFSPPFCPLLEMDNAEIARRIRDVRPDLLLVSFGCPKQEKWIAMHYESLGVPVSIGVGATIDFLAGHQKRAPLWMQKSGTEWLHRLAQEPRRLFKRYANDLVVFGAGFASQWKHHRSRRPSTGHEAVTLIREEKSWRQAAFPTCVDATLIRNSQPVLDHLLDGRKHCWLQVNRVRFLDSAGIGLLIQMQKRLESEDRRLVLLSPGRELRRTLKRLRLDDYFLTALDAAAAQRLCDTVAYDLVTPVALNSGAAPTPLAWRGDITVANAPVVWQTTEAHLSALRRPDLVIDLSRVRFMDSTGAATMERVRRLAIRLGIRLSFRNAMHPVRNVLKHARLEQVLIPPPPARPAEAALNGDLAIPQRA